MSKLTLASNWEVQTYLIEKNINATLWENILEIQLLRAACEELKVLCHNWFYDNGKDISIHHGASIGIATSFMLYNDIETWFRLVLFLENILNLNHHIEFHLGSKEYFPKEFYFFIQFLKVDIKFIEHNLDQKGIEPTPNQLLNINRTHNSVKTDFKSKLISFTNFFKSLRDKNILPLGIKELQQKVDSNNSNVQILFDPILIGKKNSIRNIFNRNVKIISGKNHSSDFKNEQESFLLQSFSKHLNELSFISIKSKNLLESTLKNYLSKMFHSQSVNIKYYSFLLEKYNIKSSLSMTHDSPESYIIQNLIKNRSGVSFFSPHGLIAKDAQLYPSRDLLADNFFSYSGDESSLWHQEYNINYSRIHDDVFFDDPPIIKDSPCKIKSCLILLDNFQVSLASKINYFEYLKPLIETLGAHNVNEITVRPHPSFYNYLNSIDLDLQNMINVRFTLQNPSEVTLKTCARNFDVIIGPLTTSIYESIYNSTFFIPYVPSFFIKDNQADFAKIQWLPSLYPNICLTPNDLQMTLRKLCNSPQDEYKSFLESVKSANINISGKDFWNLIEKLINSKN